MKETTDQEMPHSPGKHSNTKTRSDASGTAARKGEKRKFVDMTLLIRSIQRAEGNPDCFRKPGNHCDRLDCAWRSYCLGRNIYGKEEI